MQHRSAFFTRGGSLAGSRPRNCVKNIALAFVVLMQHEGRFAHRRMGPQARTAPIYSAPFNHSARVAELVDAADSDYEIEPFRRNPEGVARQSRRRPWSEISELTP